MIRKNHKMNQKMTKLRTTTVVGRIPHPTNITLNLRRKLKDGDIN